MGFPGSGESWRQSRQKAREAGQLGRNLLSPIGYKMKSVLGSGALCRGYCHV